MKKRQKQKGTIRFAALLLCALSVSAVFTAIAGTLPSTNQPAAYPDWWFERDVIPQTGAGTDYLIDYSQADDYAALNQGQLKHIARAAYDELVAKLDASVLSGTQGQALTALISSWYEL